MSALPRPAPAEVLRGFVAAVRRHDSSGVWAALSPQTRRRLGRRGAASLETTVGGDAVVILNLRLTSEWAVAAVTSSGGAYAAALRDVGGRWRVELGAPVAIEQLGNGSHGRVARPPVQLAAQIRAPRAPILDAGMWLDGRGFPLHSGGTSARFVSVYGVPPGSIRQGPHVVVAFARAGADAAAKAWTFTVAPRR
jgi:hypothetical protein